MLSESNAFGRVVTIHQPEFLPWLGFFDKMRHADVFVLLDNVQLEKGYFHNRNRIRIASGWIWLTVPVLSKGRLHQWIRDVEIDGRRDWQMKQWKTLQLNYRRAPYFERYREFFEDMYLRRSWSRLVDLNVHLIRWGAGQFGLKPEFLRASELGVKGRASNLLLAICKKLNAKAYLSGISGKAYLNETLFQDHGIAVEYQEFYHPIYRQLYEPFEPCMAFIDLLFNYGAESRRILFDAETKRLKTVFT